MTTRGGELTRLRDVDLVEKIYELVQTIESDDLTIELYFLLEEAFGRFAPGIELELIQRNNVGGDEGLQQSIDRMGAQHVARLTARAERRGQGEGGDGS
jgi:hypothetical protein